MEEQLRLSALYRSVTEANAALEQKSFANFDLHFPPDALADFEALRVHQSQEYDNFGRMDIVADELAQFLTQMGNPPDLSRRVATNINHYIHESLAAVHAETAWLTLRASIPTTYFDRPRWHRDGCFYTQTSTPQRKIVTTLKGAQTLLNHLHPSLSEEFDKLQGSDNERNTDRLIDPNNSRAARKNQGTIFIVGTGDERDAVHSEPPIRSERYFLSLLPGSRAQIEELRTNWKAPVSNLVLKPV